MQVSVRSEATAGAPPPVRPEYLRTRRAVTREAKGLESVQQLAIASEAGWRTPWVLPPIGKRWREPISARLMLLFLGWLLEGSVRPSWAKGGLVVMDGATRTLIGSIEDRDHLTGELVPGDWARLLRCSAKQARRCIHLAQRLGLVEQIRNRAPQLRAKCEQPAAYLPTVKLLEWLRDRKPASDLFDLPETDKMSDPQKSSQSSNGVEDSLRPEGLHEVGHRAPDAAAELEVPSVTPPPPPSEPPAKARLQLVGTVPGASEAAPVGEGRAAGPPRLLAAGVSERPATPPAEPPPGVSEPPALSPAEESAFLSELIRVVQRAPGVGRLVPAEDELARRAAIAAQLARLRDREPGDPPAGGAA
jgi:hypothetical protein